MWRTILGLIVMFIGVFMVIKSEKMLNTFGRIAFFEKYLGVEGGSRLGYKIIGTFAIFIGILIFTDLINGFMEWLFSPLLRLSETGPQ